MRTLKFLTAATVLLTLAYCKSTKTASATVPATPKAEVAYTPGDKQVQVAQTRWANTVTDELVQGHTIYITKCAECHIAFDIMEFGEKKWIHEIEKMSPKAKLTAEEKTKLTKHILSYREANAPTKAK